MTLKIPYRAVQENVMCHGMKLFLNNKLNACCRYFLAKYDNSGFAFPDYQLGLRNEPAIRPNNPGICPCSI